MRTTVYNAIMERLRDGRWHEIREIEELTHYPNDWLKQLTREGRICVDAPRGRVRLA